MGNVFDDLSERMSVAMEKNQRYRIKNLDGSHLTKEIATEMVSKIDGLQWVMTCLQTDTKSIGGFCSYYPDECLRLLTTMRTILEEDLKCL